MCVKALASAFRSIRRDPAYHGSKRRTHGRGRVVLLAGAIGLVAGGCSMSFPMTSVIPGLGGETGDDADITGSVPMRLAAAKTAPMPENDWTFAEAALREALEVRDKDISVPWQNPMSHASGTVTPVAAGYISEGLSCRDFLASHVQAGRENWLEGTACRVHHGPWDVRHARVLRRS